MIRILIATVVLISATAFACYDAGDILIKMKPGRAPAAFQIQGISESPTTGSSGNIELLGSDWVHVEIAPAVLETTNTVSIIESIRANPDVEYVQPNYRMKMIEDFKVSDPEIRKMLESLERGEPLVELLPRSLFDDAGVFAASMSAGGTTKPPLPSAVVTPMVGADPLETNQWGMKSIRADKAWAKFPGDKRFVVAVIDTGVDYHHEDLVGNIWQNPGEIPNNNIDDDGNGFVDDEIGWDFSDNDNKPFDVTSNIFSSVLIGGNPGHGTHCAGNIAAVGNNSIGISGVAPNVSLMVLRFLNAKGQGTTAGAVKAINYAVANGAKVLSNSWGSEGDDPKEDNRALKDAIAGAMKHDVLFVAAAGNGHMGKGYDNDTDSRPGVPASYNYENIVSVAAIDANDALGKFSNWGKRTVHVAAPGVAVYSTMTRNRYSDAVLKIGGFKIPWDGTSMATPHVAGAAALVWSAHPQWTALEVKKALLETVTPIPALAGKIASGGKINVEAALKR